MDNKKDTLETCAKIAAASIAALYVLGLIITNLQLALYHVNDFSIVRARHILTGVGFCIYLGAPLILWILPAEVASLVPRRYSIVFFAACLVGSTCLFPTACQYFLAPLYTNHSALSAVTVFWNQYYGIALWNMTTLWIIPSSVLYAINRWPAYIPNLFKFRHLFIFFSGLGVISQIAVYAYFIHPNVSASVGGGQPEVVDVFFKLSCTLPQNASATSSRTNGHAVGAIVWHRDEVNTHLTFARDFAGPSKPGRHVYSIRNDEIEALRHISASVLFDATKKTRTLVFMDDDFAESRVQENSGSMIVPKQQTDTLTGSNQNLIHKPGNVSLPSATQPSNPTI